jgi:hypothetical protein
MNDRVIAILLELHSEYEHGPAEYALIEEALGLMSPSEPLLGVATEEDSRGVRSMTWTDGSTGVPWLAYIVWPGEAYGRFDFGILVPHSNTQRVCRHEGSYRGSAFVEFWDRRYPHDLVHKAQFVSRYYLDTLLKHNGGGLNLMGSESAWKLDARSMALLRRYLLEPASPTVVES